jgi:hypothetical protein
MVIVWRTNFINVSLKYDGELFPELFLNYFLDRPIFIAILCIHNTIWNRCSDQFDREERMREVIENEMSELESGMP